jgi:hypothetical protein
MLGVPAFKFVLVFISLLLSHLLKAVRMPIVAVQTSVPAERPETIALHGDHGAAGSRNKTADICPKPGQRLSKQIVAGHEQIVFANLDGGGY